MCTASTPGRRARCRSFSHTQAAQVMPSRISAAKTFLHFRMIVDGGLAQEFRHDLARRGRLRGAELVIITQAAVDDRPRHGLTTAAAHRPAPPRDVYRKNS